jgi:hypothetical protein
MPFGSVDSGSSPLSVVDGCDRSRRTRMNIHPGEVSSATNSGARGSMVWAMQAGELSALYASLDRGSVAPSNSAPVFENGTDARSRHSSAKMTLDESPQTSLSACRARYLQPIPRSRIERPLDNRPGPPNARRTALWNICHATTLIIGAVAVASTQEGELCEHTSIMLS